MMTPDELDKLEAVAGAATPGPWKLWGTEVRYDKRGDGDVDGSEYICSAMFTDIEGRLCTVNAAHIAAWNPTTALALLGELRAVREALLDCEMALCHAPGCDDEDTGMPDSPCIKCKARDALQRETREHGAGRK